MRIAVCDDDRRFGAQQANGGIGDRAEAIHHGIATLGPDDVLVIAGKGHETGQIVGDRVFPFNDAQVARAAIDVLDGKGT